MANLTYAQLMKVWLDAAKGTSYDTKGWAALMAAIAEAESSGDPLAYNPDDNNGTQTSWGLWQISDGTHAAVSTQWSNPLVNAQLALQKLQSSGLGAWGTYDTGAYKAYLSESTTPASTIPATGGTAGQAAVQLTAAEQAESLTAAGACAIGFDQHIGLFFGHFGPTISFCLLGKTQVRAIMGGVYIAAGALTGLVAAVVLIAATGQDLAPLGRQLERVPGVGAGAAWARSGTPPRYQGRHDGTG
jgi:Lysozyme like domain